MSHGAAWTALGVAVAAFVWHASYFGQWTIDDAGISFAYARNLAAGHGLVSQPGLPPVEGFSNPLWTLLVAALYRLGLFAVDSTPKVLSLLLVAGVFWVIWRDLSSRASAGVATVTTLLVLAACTPFVIWTTSGLENPLLALLVIASCAIGIGGLTRARAWPLDAAAGTVAALAALTRPDAVLYAAAYPIAAVFAEWQRGALTVASIVRRWSFTLAGFLPVVVSYWAFRFFYFGELVPNTYYAKEHPSLAGLLSPGKFLDLVESASGDLLFPFLAFSAAATVAIIARRALTTRTVVLLLHLGIATATYLVMPYDWMGEFRFATPFYPLLYWSVADITLNLRDALRPSIAVRRAIAVAALICAAQAGVIFAARTVAFRADPPVDLGTTRAFAEGFDQLAAALNVAGGSILTPDLGGMLLDSSLRVVDLAGLCDPIIARGLTMTGDVSGLHRYVFGEVRPTFIHTLATFQRLSRLHEDPRLAADYVPLHESQDGPSDWASYWPGLAPPPPWWADYVRRDVLGPNLERLPEIRATYARTPLAAFDPWIRPPDRLREGWPQLRWASAILFGRLGEPDQVDGTGRESTSR